MDYHFEMLDNVMKVSLEGRLVAACSEEFKDTMFERLKDQQAIIFDLEKLVHIDSSGLGALVSILQWCNTRDSVIKLACLQPRPRIVFEITKVCRVFDIYDSVEAALASFKGQ